MGCGCGGGRRNFARRAPMTTRSAARRGIAGRTPSELQALAMLMNRKRSQASIVKNRRLIERKRRLAIAKRILGK